MTPSTMTIVGEELEISYKNIYMFFTFTPYNKAATHVTYFRAKNMSSFRITILIKHKKIDAYCSMLLGTIWEVKPSSRKEAQLVALAGTLS